MRLMLCNRISEIMIKKIAVGMIGEQRVNRDEVNLKEEDAR